MSNKRGKDIAIGVVVGGVVGSLAALLFAPKSGKDLRGDIANQAQQIGNKTKEWAETAGTKAHELARTVQEQAADWVDRAKEAAQCLAKRTSELDEPSTTADVSANIEDGAVAAASSIETSDISDKEAMPIG